MDKEPPTTLVRPMRVDDDGFPVLGASLSTLGVWPNKGIPVAVDGMVQPESGGMSVTPDRWEDVPHPLMPRELGGEGRHPLFPAGSMTSTAPSRPPAPHGVPMS